MAVVDDGHTNLAMESDEQENKINSNSAENQPVADGQPSDLHDNDELKLRVDKLATDPGSGTLNTEVAIDLHEPMDSVAFHRDRPFSASTRSRTTVSSSRSRVSMSPSIRTTDYTSSSLFSYKSEIYSKAVNDCISAMVQADPDGELQSSWLLTEIDHWDNEKERVVILTENSLLIVKYDFIRQCAIEGKRIPLITISKLQIGDLVYPASSVMPKRDYGGVRIYYGDPASTTFSQRWNPWSRAMPYVTLTHHLLAYNRHENETVTYNADDLSESLTAAIDNARRRFVGENRDIERITVEESQIVIESYMSLIALIHNQSKLGFYLERGGVSF